jgi:hypothetical protein
MPILTILINLAVQVLIAWIKSRLSAAEQKEALAVVEEVEKAAYAQKSTRPILDALKRIRAERAAR